MKKRSGLVMVLGLALAPLAAQYEPDTIPPLPSITDVFVLPGVQAESMYTIGLEQWRQLAPESELLATDLGDYKYSYLGDDGYTRAAILAVSLSIKLGGPARTKRSGPYLRAGFAYQSHSGNELALRREIRTPYDTLVSSQTGAVTYLDSLNISSYYLSHQYSQLHADASLIFLKEYPRHWSLYGGGGIQVGFAFNGSVSIVHSTERRTDPGLVTGAGPFGDHQSEFEELRTRSDFCMGLYAPLGVTYRLSERHPFWRALNLTYELRPTLSFGGVPEVDLGGRIGVGQYFGLRVDLAK